MEKIHCPGIKVRNFNLSNLAYPFLSVITSDIKLPSISYKPNLTLDKSINS